MDSNWFDIEIITTTKKKWNVSLLFVFPILFIVSILLNSTLYYILCILWAVITFFLLLYDYIQSKSLVTLSTKLLFKDDSFSIMTDDSNMNRQIKKEEVTNITFDKKKNHIQILQKDKILYEFTVNAKTLDELLDTFSCFGYKCDIVAYI